MEEDEQGEAGVEEGEEDGGRWGGVVEKVLEGERGCRAEVPGTEEGGEGGSGWRAGRGEGGVGRG